MSKPLDLHADVTRLVTVGGLIVIAHGAAAPADASTGYAGGCLFIDTTGNTAYINKGDEDSSNFDEITTS